MLIINADDWGRSKAETEAALLCVRELTISSVTAMVFMENSEAAAALAKEHNIDVGLHLNFAECFTDKHCEMNLRVRQKKLVSFLMVNKYSQLVFNPLLHGHFQYCYQAQADEFERLYGRSPSHVDGHHHMHLCANVVLGNILPVRTRLRRHFSFFPGEKNLLNRAYRSAVDKWLVRRYRMADFFFSLLDCVRDTKLSQVTALAKTRNVELMSHPVDPVESEFLRSEKFNRLLHSVTVGSYGNL